MDYGKEQKFDLDQYNLDTDEWDSPAESQHIPSTLGNKAISASEVADPASELNPSELGQIVPTLPPGYTESNPSPENTAQPLPTDRHTYQSNEEKLRAGVDSMLSGEAELSADQDAAKFVDKFYDNQEKFHNEEAV